VDGRTRRADVKTTEQRSRGAAKPDRTHRTPHARTHDDGDRRPSAATQPSRPLTLSHSPANHGRFHSENNLLPSSPRDAIDGVDWRCVMHVCFTRWGAYAGAERWSMGGGGVGEQQTYERGRRLPPIHTRTRRSAV